VVAVIGDSTEVLSSGRDEGRSSEGETYRIVSVDAISGGGGEVSANRAYLVSGVFRPGCSRYFLPRLLWTKRPLGAVVIKRDVEVVNEEQMLSLILAEPDEEIDLPRSLASSAFRRAGWLYVGVFGEPYANNAVVGAFDRVDHSVGQHSFTNEFSGVHGALGLKKQIDHDRGPTLSSLLVEKDQFPDDMGVAFPMGAVLELIVGLVVIVDGDAFELRQNADLSHGLGAFTIRDVEIHQLVGGGGVEPATLAAATEARLVEIRHASGDNQRFDCGDGAFDSRVEPGSKLAQSPLAETNLEHVPQEFRCAGERGELAVHTVVGEPFHALIVLDAGVDALRKLSADGRPAVRAHLHDAPMVCHELGGDYAMSLTNFVDGPGHVIQDSPAFAHVFAVVDGQIGSLHFKRLPFVANLPACFSASPGAKTFRFWLRWPVGRWGLGAVPTVQREAGLKLLDNGVSVGELSPEPLIFGPQSFDFIGDGGATAGVGCKPLGEIDDAVHELVHGRVS